LKREVRGEYFFLQMIDPVVPDITYNDMVTAQPFGNTFDVGEIEGQYIKEMFEVTMTPYSYGRAYADVNLLQLSGKKSMINYISVTTCRF
jgi:2',3'-cyclic-nucleotide 2'-phosphodiesterase (5'-nucleotidase family)